MEEMYWITRLDSVVGLLFSLLVALVVALVYGMFNWLDLKDGGDRMLAFGFFSKPKSEEEKEREEEERRAEMGRWRRFSRRCAIALAVTALCLVFVPRTKTMMMIYGIGGVVDYAKQSEELRGLPEKCVKALDMFMDEYASKGDDEERE